MKELPYFKFYPGEWSTRDVIDCSMQAQGLFINICSIYWTRGCELTLTRVQRKFNTRSTELQELLDDGIFDVSDDQISINFLDEQFEQFAELSKLKSRAGKASAKKRKGNTRSTPVQQMSNKREKIREDKIREDKIPAYLEFKDYALSKKPTVDLVSLKLKYESWVENGWKDGNGNKIVNWKSKLLNTIVYMKEKVVATGRNPVSEAAPKDYGVPSPTAVPMPESIRKKIANIGKA